MAFHGAAHRLAVADRRDAEPGLGQVFGQQVANLPVVIDDQQVFRRRAHGGILPVGAATAAAR